MTGRASGLGRPTFEFLVLHLGTQALMELGEIRNPVTGDTQASPVRAEFTLGLLRILEEKTRGRRTDREEQILTDVIGRVVSAMTQAGE